MTAKPLLVLGLGNVLMQDDGVGVRVVETLRERKLPEQVVCRDGSVEGYGLIELFQCYDPIIVCDAVRMNEAPGTARWFRPHAARSFKTLKRYSLHQVDFLEVLKLAQELGPLPTIWIFGVEPFGVDYGLGLTDGLKNLLNSLVSQLEQKVNELVKGVQHEAA